MTHSATRSILGALTATGLAASLALHAAPPRPAESKAASPNAGVAFDLDLAALKALVGQSQRVQMRHVPLSTGRSVDLELERFSITTPRTRFVLGRLHGPDVPLDFDPDSVTLLRGRVTGHPESSVFLALSDHQSYGRIDFGPGAERFQFSSDASVGMDADRRRMNLSPISAGTALPPGLNFCGAGDLNATPDEQRTAAGSGSPVALGRRVIDVAVETDHELFLRAGGTVEATNTYVLELYALISTIYERDVNSHLNLSFVRVWDTPADLFNMIDPLNEFANYWQFNEGAVQRDVAQFISGRRNMPYGGVAYLSALCGSAGYSVCGYLAGSFPDSLEPNVESYDVHVVAHELGHNCGTSHTHAYGIDTCNNFAGPSYRSTIMSYCSQTRMGGNGNTDLRFHATVQTFMETHINASVCVIDDCNLNGTDDALDIGVASTDSNFDGIPDECQDCNENGVLDPIELTGFVAIDLDGNGVPDECEPDCNTNGVPDALDISSGSSPDAYGNNIPDECEEDCNSNGISDYTEILADMTLDLDRDTHLDDCQDCDNDGTNDVEALNAAGFIWVASNATNALAQFHARSGVRTATSDAGFVSNPQDLIITPDFRVLVSSADDDRIVEFDRHGAYVGDFVPAGLGGLNYPTSMTIGPNGNLFVCSRDLHTVMEYALPSGAYEGVFSWSPAELFEPFGLTFGPDGHLYVTSSNNEVIKFDGATGAYMERFVQNTANGGLNDPRQLLFTPDGLLVVASFNTKQLLKYDGATGVWLGKFNNGGDDNALTFDQPWGLRMGPDGLLYASRNGAVSAQLDEPLPEDIAELHINSTRIYIYEPETGDFLRSHVIGNDSGLDNPSGFDFVPRDGFDCNGNYAPDACDIASGLSADINANGVPDTCECPGDFSADGMVGITEFLMVLANWGLCDECPPSCPGDIDASCSVGVLDFLYVLTHWGPCDG